MIEYAFLLFGYLICAGIVGGILYEVLRFEKDDRDFLTFLGAMLWPVALMLVLVRLISKNVNRKISEVNKVAVQRVHSHRISEAKYQAMDDDVGRANGSTEVLVNYDYLTCPTCYGEGPKRCPECGGKRIVRKRVKHEDS